jgi:hypothetical protein
MNPSTKQQSRFLEVRGSLRWVCGLLGVVLAITALFVVYFPPQRIATEQHGRGHTTKTTVSSADTVMPAVVLFVTGIAILLYGVNGLRITRLTAGGVSAETTSPVVQRAEDYYEKPDGVESLPVNAKSSESPEPTQPPAQVLKTANEDLNVYELADVPTTVIKDALDNWPSTETLPSNLGEFEFASRRRGKGNNPWTLKFRGRKPVVVSYGGQAKKEPTVTPDA